MLVVLDTNVVVSGLLNGSGMPGRIIDLALEDRFQVAYDDRILGEYEDVLARPVLHIRPALARAIIDHIELTGQWIDAEKVTLEGLIDPDDLPFIEVFVTSNAQALVAGNLRHFEPLLEKHLAIFTPTKFINTFFPELE